MRKRIIGFLMVLTLAVIAAGVNAAVSKATTVGPIGPTNSNFFAPSCNFGNTSLNGFSGYKESGASNIYQNTPSWSTVQFNQTAQWWSVWGWLGAAGGNGGGNWGPHTALWAGVLNQTTNQWIQVGIIMGYDPWGNPLDTNYPIGKWTNSVHPNYGGGPSYTPNGTWAEIIYAEHYDGTTEHFQSIGTQTLSNGLTFKITYNGSGQYSIGDSAGNPWGGTGGNADHINLGTSGQFDLQSYQEDFANGNLTSGGLCGFVDSNTDNMASGNNGYSFWTNYQGCSDLSYSVQVNYNGPDVDSDVPENLGPGDFGFGFGGGSNSDVQANYGTGCKGGVSGTGDPVTVQFSNFNCSYCQGLGYNPVIYTYDYAGVTNGHGGLSPVNGNTVSFNAGTTSSGPIKFHVSAKGLPVGAGAAAAAGGATMIDNPLSPFVTAATP